MKTITLIFALLLTSVAYAGIEERRFENPQQEARYQQLIDELRCLVCQNQNLADSNAELAQDLREQVYTMIQKGDSNDEIIDFMVTRYGDFVLYRPPFKTSTLLLWLGPFLILFTGLVVVVQVVRKRQHTVAQEMSDAERNQIRQLLDTDKDTKQ